MATLISIEVNNIEGIPLELEERMVKEGTDNYENLQNLPTLNGEVIKGNINESDPTVPEWAKEPTKPKYTAEEVGATTSDEVNEMIDDAIKDKVDKVNGKGLSSNDYTDAEKDKLASVEEGATANVGTITGIKLNGEVKGTSGIVNLGNVVTDKSDKLDKNQGRENSGKYMKVDMYGNLIPAEVQGGGGGSYTQGDGISIVNDVISVNNTIARKTDIPVIPKVPTKTSELTNDSNYVSDAEYTHVNDELIASWGYIKESGSDYSEGDGINITDKVISVDDTIARKSDIPVVPPIPEVPTKTSDLINDSDFVSDANYTHVDEALVASWGFSKGGGGGGSSDIYSLDEVEVGTWINGKKIYQKTYELLSPSQAKNTIYDLDVEIDTCIECRAFIVAANSTVFQLSTATTNTTTENFFQGWIRGSLHSRPNSFSCIVGSVADWLNRPMYLTIKYTKVGA